MSESQNKKNSFANTALSEVIFQLIQKADSRSISFSKYMEVALYHTVHGYYAKPSQRVIGRGGDFFTSVSVGDTFGFLLSHQIEKKWVEDFNSVENFTIIEQGAHDGQLAIDIVSTLETCRPDFFEKGGRYVIIEPRESVRRELQELSDSTGLSQRLAPIKSREGKVHDFQGKRFRDSGGVQTGVGRSLFAVESYQAALCDNGIFLANELLDAFPVHRVQFENGIWRELHVTWWNDGFAWQPVDIEKGSELFEEVSQLGTDFAEGYTTEVCVAVHSWLAETAQVFSKRGLFWIFDYGFEDDDFFASHRTTGTLQCYRNHEKSENPFETPGEIDLTTHVNFSQLARAARGQGLTDYSLTDQHHFLIRAAEKWLREIDGVVPDAKTAKRIRQFQTLTHPGMMGQSFKVAEFVK